MIKKCIFLMLFVFLSACSHQNEKIETEKGEDAVKEMKINGKDIKVGKDNTIPTTIAEWKNTLNASEWYQNTISNKEVLFQSFVDFDGDQIVEYIIGSKTQGSVPVNLEIGEYDVLSQKWQSIYSYKYDEGIYQQPSLCGILANGNNQEVAVISMFVPGASGFSNNLMILKKSKDLKKIIDGYYETSHTPDDKTYTVDSTKNTVKISSNVSTIEYTLHNNWLTSPESEQNIRLYEGVPFTTNEKFISLLNNSFFHSGIQFGDKIDLAKKKDVNIIDEDYYEGGPFVGYKDYALFYNEDAPYINTIMLFNFENVSLSSLEQVIGQKLEVDVFNNEMEGKVENRVHFTFDGYEYTGEISSNSKDGNLVKLMIYNNTHMIEQ